MIRKRSFFATKKQLHKPKGFLTFGNGSANGFFPAVRIRFHKPHPDNILKPYILDIIKAGLDECNLLTDKKKR